jgi:surface antigen
MEVVMHRNLPRSIVAAALFACGGAAAQVGLGFLAETPMARFNADDLKLMNSAIERALAEAEIGTTVRWANEATSSSGEVTAQRAFENGGRPCRDLRVVNRHRRLENSGLYTMCRDNGKWTPVP